MPKIGTLTAGMSVALSLLSIAAADAAVTYKYTGNDFTSASGSFSTSDSVDATVVLGSPLSANLNLAKVNPISFSFFNGRDTITNLNSNDGDVFEFSTDASGNITYWDTDAGGDNGTVAVYANTAKFLFGPGFLAEGDAASEDVCLATCADGFASSIGSGSNSRDAGKWSISAAPEPNIWALTLLGVFGIGAALRGRRRRFQTA